MKPSVAQTSVDGRESRRNNFDLLRLLFAVLVILTHSSSLIDGNNDRDLLFRVFHNITLGDLAVDGFFLLSGYLILQSWESDPRVWQFFKKRILRIYPGFIVAALVSSLIVGPLGANAIEYFSQFETLKVLKSIAILKVPAVPPAFDGLPYPVVNGAMWTIFFEFQCYVAVLVLGLTRLTKRKYIWVFAALSLLLLREYQKLNLLIPDDSFYFSLLRLGAFFFVGGCFYLFKDQVKFNRTLGFVSIVVLAIGLYTRTFSEFFIATAGGYLLFYFGCMQLRVLSGFGRFPDVSYGVYLYGWPVQKLFLWYFPTTSPWTVFMVTCPVSMILGVMSWYGVERQFLKLKFSEWQLNKSKRKHECSVS